jgi:hypothetical protein
MEQFEKYAEFLHNSFPRKLHNSEWFGNMSTYVFSKFIPCNAWWYKCSEQFCQMSNSGGSGVGNYLFTYLKSCQFTEHLVDSKIEVLNSENQELKSLIYGMLDEINELKEHNKSLSDRLDLLENKPPMILVN